MKCQRTANSVLTGCLSRAVRRRCDLTSSSWIALLFFAIGVAPPCAVGQEAPAVTMHRQRAGAPNARGWYDAKSTDGHFSVSLPMPFNDFTVRAKDKDGMALPVYVVGGKSTDGVKFSATEMPKGRLTRDFDLHAYVQKFKADKNNTVSNETLLEFDGHSAIQFHVSNTRQSAFMRAIIVPSGVLLLIVEYPRRLERNVIPLVELFFASLKVVRTF